MAKSVNWLVPDAALVGGGFMLASRAAGLATTIPAGVNVVQTGGFYTAGDGGACLFERASGPFTDGASFQSLDGAWWQIAFQVFTPRMFGAKGDGANDDYPAFSNCINYANQFTRTGLVSGLNYPGATVNLLGGTYSLTSISTTTYIKCNMLNSGAGLLIPAAYAGEVVRLGYDIADTYLAGANIQLPDIYKATNSAIVSNSVGVRYCNLNDCRVFEGRIDYFASNRVIGGIGQGTVSNNIFLGQSAYGNVHISIKPEAAGWANINNFYGGDFRLGGSKVVNQYHLIMDGSVGSAVTGNNFYGTSFQGNGAIYNFYFRNAYNNRFYGGYYETGAAFTSCTVSGDTITANAHGMSVGSMVYFVAGSLPTGMQSAVPYYVVNVVDANNFKVALSAGDSAITFGSAGTSVTYCWQGEAYCDGSSGYLTYNNKFFDIDCPPSVNVNFIQNSNAYNNGIDISGNRIAKVFSPVDNPLWSGQNFSSVGTILPIFACYGTNTDPTQNPTRWKSALSSLGLFFKNAGALIGQLFSSSAGVLMYAANGGTSYEIQTCVRAQSGITITSLSCAANSTTVSGSLSLTGCEANDYVEIVPTASLPAGITFAWGRGTGTGTFVVAFGNLTASPISLTTTFYARIGKRFV